MNGGAHEVIEPPTLDWKNMEGDRICKARIEMRGGGDEIEPEVAGNNER